MQAQFQRAALEKQAVRVRVGDGWRGGEYLQAEEEEEEGEEEGEEVLVVVASGKRDKQVRCSGHLD